MVFAMRLFTGIELPAPVADRVESYIETLRPSAPLRWSPRANLHITTKFIGEWPEARLQELQRALQDLRASSFDIRIGSASFLPNPHHPHAFLLSVTSEALHVLAAQTNAVLAPLGCVREARPYRPHITLARLGDQDSVGLRRAIAERELPEFGSFSVRKFCLWSSVPSPQGSVYRVRSAYPLSRDCEE